MGWLDDIGSSLSGLFGGNSNVLGPLVSTALTGLALRQVSNSISKDNEKKTEEARKDTGNQVTIAPASDNKIPVLYGEGHFGGIITEAVMSADNKTMTYVVTLSEYTGTLLSTGGPSYYTFKNIYWGDNRIVFQGDGTTAHYTVDRNGNVDRNIDGLVKIWCYAGNSEGRVAPEGYTVGPQAAYSIVPGWSYNHMMNELIFIVVQVTYNRDKSITGLSDIKVNLQNSMTLPGDCIWDYMTNTRYGAGIAQGDIYSE